MGGKQFRIGSVDVQGAEESVREEILKTLTWAKSSASTLWEASLLKNASLFPDCDCQNRERLRLDEKSGMPRGDFRFIRPPVRGSSI